MTYAEIYADIIENCFPGVGGNPPENMVMPILRKIRTCVRMINRDYPFWFLIGLTTINTVADTFRYNLPDDFKEVEKLWYTIDNQTYGSEPLNRLDLTEHIDRGYQLSSATVEYPPNFRIDGNYLYLYPTPSDARVLNMLYWIFLAPINITSYANFLTNAEDDIALYCGEAIVNWVSSKVKLMQNEWQASELFLRDFNDAIQGAMQEDKFRRQMPENVAPYSGVIND